MVAQGSLTVTFVLPIDERDQRRTSSLLAGLAVRDAAVELTGEPGVQLKWPNDLLHEGRKLGGLLCERVMKVDLVGIGINVNLDPARGREPAEPDRVAVTDSPRGAERRPTRCRSSRVIFA